MVILSSSGSSSSPSVSSSITTATPITSFLHHSIIPFFSNIPTIGKLIILIQSLFFIASQFDSTNTIEYYFCLIPYHTLSKFFVWNIFTSSLLETELISFIFTILSVIVTSKWIINKNLLTSHVSGANIWTTSMFLWFLFVVSVLCGIFTLLTTLLLHLLTIDTPLYVKYHGFHGCILGFTMIMKQQIPDEFPINFLNNVYPRGRDVPFVALVLSVLISVVANQETDLPFIVFGFYISWVYLRFYQSTSIPIVGAAGEMLVKGDHSDSFAFHTLFPVWMHGVIVPVSNWVYRWGRVLKIVPELRVIHGGSSGGGGGDGVESKQSSLSSNFDSIFMDQSPMRSTSSGISSSGGSNSMTASALLEKHIIESSSSTMASDNDQQPIASQSSQTSKRRELAVQELEKRIQNMNHI